MRATSCLVAACAAVLLRATAEMPPPAVDVLVVGGTAKGVSAAVAARQVGATTFLVTSQPYLGEDLAGTLELDAPPETPLEKRLWANATDHAAYDYWPARQGCTSRSRGSCSAPHRAASASHLASSMASSGAGALTSTGVTTPTPLEMQMSAMT